MATKSEIIMKWAKSIEGKFINEDNAYGAQCKDLISNNIRVIHDEPYTKGNGDVMAENLIALRGWSEADQSKPLQPGDVVSYDTGGLGGHVFVVLADDGKTITYIDQNGGPEPANAGPDEACVIRKTTRRSWRKVARPRWDTVAELNASAASTASGDVKADAKTYTVLKGDTLWGISRKLGVTLDALTKANPDVDADNLQVGKELNIPASTAKTYIVQKGDTLSDIAVKTGTTLTKLISLNPSIDPDKIYVGQIITIG